MSTIVNDGRIEAAILEAMIGKQIVPKNNNTIISCGAIPTYISPTMHRLGVNSSNTGQLVAM
jgi:hypothetical protein